MEHSMWTRKELKQRAKDALKRNYWKTVLVSLLLALITTGSFTYNYFGNHGGSSNASDYSYDENGNLIYEEDYEVVDDDWTVNSINDVMAETVQGVNPFALIATVAAIAAVGLVIAALAMAVGFAISAFLYNPFEVGMRRFMVKGVEDTAQVKEIGYGFDHCYKNIVKTMFFRDLYTFLWTLLFIIPGIYKMYQYRMVPYIMTETPDMDYKAALALSKEMMDGHKWDTFVLDLSFILWHFLGMITCGIVEILYVAPYQNLTNAALYCALRMKHTEDEVVVETVVQ